jgi:predicted GNAT family N-acyltransferase
LGERFEVLELRELGLDAPPAREARAWVEGMTPERDREDGLDFWRWIERYFREDSGDPLLGTRLLLEKGTRMLVAMASLVSDDRDVGKEFGIDGIWLGGVNVRPEYRGRNLVDVILGALAASVQRRADESGQEVAVNLVTSSGLVGLYTRHGFEEMTRSGGHAPGAAWCRRVFRPSPVR